MFSKKKRRRTRITMKSGGGYLSGVYDATLAPAGKALAYGSNAVVSRSNALASSVGSTLAYGSNAVVSTGAEIWKQLRKKEGPTNVEKLETYFQELCKIPIFFQWLDEDYYDLKAKYSMEDVDKVKMFTRENVLFEAKKPIYESYIRLIGPIIANKDYEKASMIVHYWGKVVAKFARDSPEGESFRQTRYNYFTEYKPKYMDPKKSRSVISDFISQKKDGVYYKITSLCSDISIELAKGLKEGESIIDNRWFPETYENLEHKKVSFTGMNLRMMNAELTTAYDALKKRYLEKASFIDIVNEAGLERSMDLRELMQIDEGYRPGLF